ncbi:DUF86 domain-containing protein [bacterium]|nr:DUF86 domain-containing protein [bacterium]
MGSRDKEYLRDILDAAKNIQEFLGELSREEFVRDRLHKSAVLHQLIMIGEVTKRLSTKFREAHPQIQWRKITGMRDVLIHAYDHVDESLVWDTAMNYIPDLISKLQDILKVR